MRRAARPLLVCAAACLALAACGKANMAEQRKLRSWDQTSFFANGQVMQRMPPGTVAHGLPGAPVPQPARIDAAMLAQGQTMFGIYCAPCHGASGDGDGMIVQRGFPRPPALFAADLRQAKAAQLYDVITQGHGAMYGYADRVAPADRWAIVAWLRALQARAGTPVARLAPQDLAQLNRQVAP